MRFALEARERLRVEGDIFEQEFERDKAVEAKVLGLVDHAHPTAPQPPKSPLDRNLSDLPAD